jgi:hypothetical protein
MRWRKLGMVFCPEYNHEWMISHAANTAAEQVDGEIYRIYFSSRDRENRSSICSLDVDLRAPTRVLRVCDKPVVSPGPIGAFDDSGASMGWLTCTRGRRHLYYLGWNLGVTVPWRNSIGLAVSDSADGDFVKASPAPVMDRSAEDPYSISYPCVLQEAELWRMWYGSNLSWGKSQREMAHVLKYAESQDGIHWRRDGGLALGFKSTDEYAMSKPCVLRENGRYRMWYSYRGSAYRIGYAESDDGRRWHRLDERVGIDVSEHGWDSESVEYPFVFEHGTQKYMLYNGNGYGRTGFGIAVQDN